MGWSLLRLIRFWEWRALRDDSGVVKRPPFGFERILGVVQSLAAATGEAGKRGPKNGFRANLESAAQGLLVIVAYVFEVHRV